MGSAQMGLNQIGADWINNRSCQFGSFGHVGSSHILDLMGSAQMGLNQIGADWINNRSCQFGSFGHVGSSHILYRSDGISSNWIKSD